MQAETLMKTLVLFSSRPITVHIAHNDIAIVKHMEEAVLKFGLGDWLRYKEYLSKSNQIPSQIGFRVHRVPIWTTGYDQWLENMCHCKAFPSGRNSMRNTHIKGSKNALRCVLSIKESNFNAKI